LGATACAPGLTACESSANWIDIVAELQNGSTTAAPVPRAGQIAPKM